MTNLPRSPIPYIGFPYVLYGVTPPSAPRDYYGMTYMGCPPPSPLLGLLWAVPHRSQG